MVDVANDTATGKRIADYEVGEADRRRSRTDERMAWLMRELRHYLPPHMHVQFERELIGLLRQVHFEAAEPYIKAFVSAMPLNPILYPVNSPGQKDPNENKGVG